MPKKYRLSRADFKKMRGFTRVHGRFFSLSAGMIPARDTAGCAIVVSKKVASSAVKRNSIKRRCRPVLLSALRGARTPTVTVCTAKKGAAEATSAEVRADLHALLKKAA